MKIEEFGWDVMVNDQVPRNIVHRQIQAMLEHDLRQRGYVCGTHQLIADPTQYLEGRHRGCSTYYVKVHAVKLPPGLSILVTRQDIDDVMNGSFMLETVAQS